MACTSFSARHASNFIMELKIENETSDSSMRGGSLSGCLHCLGWVWWWWFGLVDERQDQWRAHSCLLHTPTSSWQVDGMRAPP